MLSKETLARPLDNSGARLVRVVGTPKGRPARVGDLVTVSVQRVAKTRRITKGSIHPAVVVQCRFPTSRPFGHGVRFPLNGVVLLRRSEARRGELLPSATRLSHTVSHTLRQRGYLRLLLLSPNQL